MTRATAYDETSHKLIPHPPHRLGCGGNFFLRTVLFINMRQQLLTSVDNTPLTTQLYEDIDFTMTSR